jgi:hypothetical protein
MKWNRKIISDFFKKFANKWSTKHKNCCKYILIVSESRRNK